MKATSPSDQDLLLEATLTQFINTSRASRPSAIDYIDGAPSPAMLSTYQNNNVPVVFRNAVNHWPAHKQWSAAYFQDVMGEDLVTVAETPNGMADSIVDDLFVMPHESQTTMADMLKWLKAPVPPVRYLQLQNGSLNLEFQKLAKDVDAHGPNWATDVFGQQCLANIWIGNHLSTTSLHHDPYENLYVQVRGSKKFTLFAPEEYHYLNEQRYRSAQYTKKEDGSLEVTALGSGMVPWLTKPTDEETVLSRMEVTLQPGEVLYLPALWFHQVEQIDDPEGLCVAVNFWYDLDYQSALWRNWKFCRKISMLVHGRLTECDDELREEEDL